MKKSFLMIFILFLMHPSFCQEKKWAANIGIEGGTDAGSGLAGVSLLNTADNPLVNSSLDRTGTFNAALYLEFLKLKKRADTGYGSVRPAYGLKTKIDWSVFNADNNRGDGGENLVLGVIGVPLLFEISLGHKQGVTRSWILPGSTTYTKRRNYDRSVTINENRTPDIYYSGGDETSWGSFIYLGPKMCYLTRATNSGNSFTGNNLEKNYVALTGGVTFYSHRYNLELSYQKGLTSIYNGRNITIDGFLVSLGINFSRRVYQ